MIYVYVAETKVLISCVVTMYLICAFVFAYAKSTDFLMTRLIFLRFVLFSYIIYHTWMLNGHTLIYTFSANDVIFSRPWLITYDYHGPVFPVFVIITLIIQHYGACRAYFACNAELIE